MEKENGTPRETEQPDGKEGRLLRGSHPGRNRRDRLPLTGIPVTKLAEQEKESFSTSKNTHKRVIGQDEAVTHISEAILRARAGIQDPPQLIGSFLLHWGRQD